MTELLRPSAERIIRMYVEKKMSINLIASLLKASKLEVHEILKKEGVVRGKTDWGK